MSAGVVVVVVGLGLASAVVFTARWRVGRWWQRRGLSPDERAVEDLADALVRRVRPLRGNRVVNDPVTGRYFAVQRRLIVVAIGVVEPDDIHDLDGIVTWHLVTRWGSPPGIGRVLRHEKPGGERFGTASLAEAHALLDFEQATGAVGATAGELRELLAQLDRAIG